mmetsp:Transcript_16656/g.42529  ORF Transcript_16656/g.42529 Transcript_16656/m.42529 type:complete len:196 (-) Transcript_16656:128-715(-)
MLSSVDLESPVNTGVMWLKPSALLYDEGLQLLRTSTFSVELGINASGRPSALIPSEFAAIPAVRATRMVASDSWNFVGGASDQGLFTLIFVIRHPGALALTSRDFHVHHYWARSKPWVDRASCASWFHAIGVLTEAGTEAEMASGIGLPRLRDDSPICGRKCYPLFRQKAEELVNDTLGRGGARYRCRGTRFLLF